MAESAAVQLSGADKAQGFCASRVHLAPGDILPEWVFAHLRTDHAGEVGAVCIYQSVLQFARDPKLRAFAERCRDELAPKADLTQYTTSIAITMLNAALVLRCADLRPRSQTTMPKASRR